MYTKKIAASISNTKIITPRSSYDGINIYHYEAVCTPTHKQLQAMSAYAKANEFKAVTLSMHDLRLTFSFHKEEYKTDYHDFGNARILIDDAGNITPSK